MAACSSGRKIFRAHDDKPCGRILMQVSYVNARNNRISTAFICEKCDGAAVEMARCLAR